jgi:hypothetical protein
MGGLSTSLASTSLAPTVLIHLSRTRADKVHHMYALNERMKNGRIFPPKLTYDSVSKDIHDMPPSLVVLD